MSAVRQDVTALAKSLGLKISCSFRRASTLPRLLPRCTQPWEYVFIRATGDVAPCCALFGSDKGAVVGNLFRQPFDDVWHGDPFREFRRASAAGTNPLCRLCPYY
jgi:radical SAM protein with 4Fe4S-binding SPASM domain